MPSVPTISTKAAKMQPAFMLRLGAFELSFGKAVNGQQPNGLSTIGGRGWFSIIREPFTGAWQRNRERRTESVLSYHAVYSCVTLIASDVAKCCIDLVEEDADGIWNKVDSASFSPVLRKPNRYQNRIKFFEQWIVSKLLAGNTYVLKVRDARKVVTQLYILDPLRTKVLVTPDGDIYYSLAADNLAGIDGDAVIVPASEIIHDVMVPLYHPLCGVSPLTASGVAAYQGLAMQDSSSKFFQNGATPSGILTAPQALEDADAERFKKYWEENFTGDNAGKVAVLGGGLKFEAMTMKAIDAQLIDQLKWTAAVVCATFHVPAYKVGVGDPPPYQNIEATEQQYYSQCLQKFFECIELCLDEGLGLTDVRGKVYGTQFDLDDLLRMDSKTLAETEDKLKNIKTPNESRKRLNLKPVSGGNAVYRQQQDYSLDALAKRDSSDDPFAKSSDGSSSKPAVVDDAENDNSPDGIAAAAQLAAWSLKEHLGDPSSLIESAR